MKVLVADDEREARELLLHYLKECTEPLQVMEAADGITTLAIMREWRPDILFLDIKMPELGGIEVLQQKDSGLAPALVFTTAYDQYALPAFDFDAVDYLLKPFEKARFERALNRAINHVKTIGRKEPASYITQLPVKTGSKTELVDVHDIIYLQAEGAYVQVVTLAKTYLVTDAVYEMESMLDPAIFLRVHRSFIVNIRWIVSIQSLLNGDHLLILRNGKEIRASRTYREKIKGLQSR